jgi:hypothetical protein
MVSTAAPGACAALAIATRADGVDPLRPALAPRLRSPRGQMVSTRCARRLRRACDRH